jgi:hypothetical protein
MYGDVMEAHGDTFVVHLRGRSIKCTSLEDAVAIKTADDVLRDMHGMTAEELHRLAEVLLRYDCPDEAETFMHEASRLRAAEVIAHSVGGPRPEGSL